MIIDAINEKQVLSFSYDGFQRTVEPHAVGTSRSGNDILRCFQTAGGHVTSGHEWDICLLSKISGLRMTGDVFATARPDYKKGDKGMSHIYAEL